MEVAAYGATYCSGAGALAAMNADLAVSNLPRSPAFVPLLAELTDRLVDACDVRGGMDGEGVVSGDRGLADGAHDRAWVWLLVACVACLCAELVVLRVLRA